MNGFTYRGVTTGLRYRRPTRADALIATWPGTVGELIDAVLGDDSSKL